MAPLPAGLEPSGSPGRPVSCLLFDIYGTLFISGSGDIGVSEKQGRGSGALDRLLKRYGIDGPREALLNRFHGAIRSAHLDMKEMGVDFPEVDIVQIWRRVLESRAPEDLEAFAFEFEMIVNPVHPMPNLEKTLTACRRRDVPMGIVSNAQFYTPYLFDMFLGKPPEELGFVRELIIYSYRFNRAKPSEHLFRRAAAFLEERSISPGSTLYAGNDMRNDILPARRAGFITALFAGDRRSLRQRDDDESCRGVAPDLVITDLAQIIPFLDERG